MVKVEQLNRTMAESAESTNALCEVIAQLIGAFIELDEIPA